MKMPGWLAVDLPPRGIRQRILNRIGWRIAERRIAQRDGQAGG